MGGTGPEELPEDEEGADGEEGDELLEVSGGTGPEELPLDEEGADGEDGDELLEGVSGGAGKELLEELPGLGGTADEELTGGICYVLFSRIAAKQSAILKSSNHFREQPPTSRNFHKTHGVTKKLPPHRMQFACTAHRLI